MNKHLLALKKELQNRAKIYVHIYREISKKVGQEKATAIMKRALYARGKEKGLQLFEKIGLPDLPKIAANFLEGQEDMDAFGHEVVEVGKDHVLLRLNRCPLDEAWKENGLSSQERKVMCDIAYQVDFGKFEAAGYKLKFACRIADGGKSCDLHIRKKEQEAGSK